MSDLSDALHFYHFYAITVFIVGLSSEMLFGEPHDVRFCYLPFHVAALEMGLLISFIWYLLKYVKAHRGRNLFCGYEHTGKAVGIVLMFFYHFYAITVFIVGLSSEMLFGKPHDVRFCYLSLEVAALEMGLLISFIWYLRKYVKAHRGRNLFCGYEQTGKAVGIVLMFFGNLGLYYYKGKSLELMLLSLSLSHYCLSALYYIRPPLDFGVMEFFVSATLNQSLSLYGLRHVTSWFILCDCIFIVWLRYILPPIYQQPDQPIGEP